MAHKKKKANEGRLQIRQRSWKQAQEQKETDIKEQKERRKASLAWQEETGHTVRPSLWNYRAKEREKLADKRRG